MGSIIRTVKQSAALDEHFFASLDSCDFLVATSFVHYIWELLVPRLLKLGESCHKRSGASLSKLILGTTLI